MLQCIAILFLRQASSDAIRIGLLDGATSFLVQTSEAFAKSLISFGSTAFWSEQTMGLGYRRSRPRPESARDTGGSIETCIGVLGCYDLTLLDSEYSLVECKLGFIHRENLVHAVPILCMQDVFSVNEDSSREIMTHSKLNVSKAFSKLGVAITANSTVLDPCP